MRSVLFAAVALALCGCPISSLDRKAAQKEPSPYTGEGVKASVLQHIPVGMPFEEADRYLKANGFTTSERVIAEHEKNTQIYYKRFHDPRQYSYLFTTEMRVYLDVDSGKITKVRVEHVDVGM